MYVGVITQYNPPQSPLQMIEPASSIFFLKTTSFWPQGSSQPPAHVAWVEAIIFFSFFLPFSLLRLLPFSFCIRNKARQDLFIYLARALSLGKADLMKLQQLWLGSDEPRRCTAASPSSRGRCGKTPRAQPEQRFAPGSPAWQLPARPLRCLIFVVSAEILHLFRGRHNSCFPTSPSILFGLSAAALWCWCQLLKQSVWIRSYL